jgi:hypothetical protein
LQIAVIEVLIVFDVDIEWGLYRPDTGQFFTKRLLT